MTEETEKDQSKLQKFLQWVGVAFIGLIVVSCIVAPFTDTDKETESTTSTTSTTIVEETSATEATTTTEAPPETAQAPPEVTTTTLNKSAMTYLTMEIVWNDYSAGDQEDMCLYVQVFGAESAADLIWEGMGTEANVMFDYGVLVKFLNDACPNRY